MTYMTDCHRCDRRAASSRVVWPTYTQGPAKLLVVGDAPSMDDDREGRGFAGQAGNVLRRCLIDAGFDPETEVAYTSMVFCYGGGTKKKPTPDQVSACARNLWRAVLHSNPQVIICAGKFATQEILKLDKITDVHGTFRHVVPDKAVWDAIRLEDFCAAHKLDFPLHESGVDPERMKDASFIQNFVVPFVAQGFETIDPPQFKVMPVLNPSLFLVESRKEESYLLTRDLIKALEWIDGAPDRPDKDFKAILDPEEAIAYMDEILNLYQSGEIQHFAYDLETVGPEGDERKGALKPFLPGGRVVTINLSHKPNFGRVIVMFHPEGTMTCDQQKKVANKVGELLAEVPVVGANLRFDMHWSRFKLGAKKWKIAFDTQLANYALYLGTMKNGLKEVTNQHLPHEAGYADDLQEFLSNLPKEERHFLNVPLKKLIYYAAEDVDVVLQLIPVLTQKLVAYSQWEPFHLFGIHPYAAFIEMEQNGARINGQMRDELSKVAVAEMQAIKDRFKESPYRSEWTSRRTAIALAKRAAMKQEKARNKPIQPKELDLNFGSPEQVSELLFNIAQLPIRGALGKKTNQYFPHGIPSTGDEVLDVVLDELDRNDETEQPRVDVLEMIKEYRTASKIYSTYLKKAYVNCPVVEAPEWWDNRQDLNDPRAFEAELYEVLCQSAAFNLTRARTGRTTSSGPNIQQVTKRIRKMYLSRFGKKGLIANFDVGQAELRVIAAASGDRNFIAILSDPNRDIHREVAAMGFRKPVEEITDDERFQAKSIVFGTCYGRGPESIAKQTKSSVDQAEDLQRALFAMMPQVAEWIAQKHYESDNPHFDEQARIMRQGIWTPTGRWRDLSMHYQDGERHRRAVNTPVQGGASDIIVWATGQVHLSMAAAEVRSKLWAFVHDSLVFDVIPEEAVSLMAFTRKHLVEEIPRRFPWMVVPMVVDFQFGPNWGEQVDVAYDFETGQMDFSGKYDILLETLNRFGDCLGEVRLQDDWAADAAQEKKIKAFGKWQKKLAKGRVKIGRKSDVKSRDKDLASRRHRQISEIRA